MASKKKNNSPARSASRKKTKEKEPAVSITVVKGDELAAILVNKELEPKQRFLCWAITPDEERSPKTQGELAKIIGVDQVTISRWKQDGDFMELVPDGARRAAMMYAGSVFKKTTERAIAGSLFAQELYYKYVLRLAEPESGAAPASVNNNLAVFIGGRPAEPLPVGLVAPKTLAAASGA